MEIKVRSTTKISEEQRIKMEKEAQELKKGGLSDQEIATRVAHRYLCSVSTIYMGGDLILNFHPMKCN